jgi:FHS family L-fucose permease-like MFS transporter
MRGKSLSRKLKVLAGDVTGSYVRSPGLHLDQNKSLASRTMVSMLVGFIAGSAILPQV